MTQNPSARYLETQVQTASREQLLVMLFDGAIRFAEQGRAFQGDREFEKSTHSLVRAQDIMLEIMAGLDRTIGDLLYGKLIGLYQFIYRRLIEANLLRQSGPIEDALKILRSMRDTWAEAVKKSAEERRVAPATAPVVGLSLQG